jgi:hypothetical protein
MIRRQRPFDVLSQEQEFHFWKEQFRANRQSLENSSDAGPAVPPMECQLIGEPLRRAPAASRSAARREADERLERARVHLAMGSFRVSRQMALVRNLIRADLDAEAATALLQTMLHTLNLFQEDVTQLERAADTPRYARHNGLPWPLARDDQLMDFQKF